MVQIKKFVYDYYINGIDFDPVSEEPTEEAEQTTWSLFSNISPLME